MRSFKLIFIFFILYYTQLFSFTINEDSLHYYYTYSDSIFKNNEVKLSFYKIFTNIDEDTTKKYIKKLNKLDTCQYFVNKTLGDLNYSKGCYIAASKYYKNLKNYKKFASETGIKYIHSLILSSNYKTAKTEIDSIKFSKPLKNYLKALIFYKEKKTKNALEILQNADSYFSNPDSIELWLYIKYFSLKIELLKIEKNESEAIRLAKYLLENFPNSVESIRWLNLYPYLDNLHKETAKSSNNSTKYVIKSKKRKKYWAYQFASFQNKENAKKYIIFLKSKYPKFSFYIRTKEKNNKIYYAITTIKYSSKSKLIKFYYNDLKKNINEKMVLTSLYN